MRALVELSAKISRDLDGRQLLARLDELFDDTDLERASTYQSGVMTLAAAASNVAADFGGVTAASLVIIVAEADITVKLNGTGQAALPVRVTPATDSAEIVSTYQKTTKPGLVLWRGKIDSIHFGNPSSTESAGVMYILVGEAAS